MPATITWDGGPTGQGTNWLEPVNWAGDVLPGPNDDAVIGPAADQPTILAIDWGADIHNLTVTGRTLRMTWQLRAGSVNNSGTIELVPDLNFPPILDVRNGTITNAPNGRITFPLGRYSPEGGMLWGRIDNQGTIDVDGDLAYWRNTGASFNSGTVNVTGANLFLSPDAPGTSFTNTGTVIVAAGRTFTIVSGGYTQSAGTTDLAGTLTVNGAFSQGGSSLRVALSGTTPGTQYGQVKVNGTVALDGPLVVNVGYAGAVGDTFRILDNDGTDAIRGTFSGAAEGATLVVNGQAIRISYAGGDGNDVTLTRTGPVVPVVPKVDSVRVNDGAAQRSRVTNLTVSFNTGVTFAGPAAAAFVLTRDGDATPVAFTATTSPTGGVTVVTLRQFTGAATDAGSLADGGYTLTVRASQVSTAAGSLDGNGDGTAGDDYKFGAAQSLRRLYGDASGDVWVDAVDLPAFRQTFGRTSGDPLYLSFLDGNGDGAIDGLDLTRFREAFLASPPRVAAVQVDDGSAQRSRITSLTVTFSHAVTFAGPPAAAFVLTREDGTPVTFAATVTIASDATRVTLDQFAGAGVDAGSLADGRHTLKVLASQVSSPGGALDGNADGTPGDDCTFGAAQGLVRKYGDANGDSTADAADLALFRQSFGRVAGDPLYIGGFDANGDSVINGIDLSRFRQAFGAGG